jgi:enoyl-CoA hydratase
VDRAAAPAPEAPLAARQAEIDALFAGDGLRDILNVLRPAGTAFAEDTLAAMAKNSPLSMACAVDLIRRTRGRDTIEGALELEYRFTARAMEHGDFLEGIRAAIIDKDRTPRWRHDSMEGPSNREVSAMLLPLGADSLKL